MTASRQHKRPPLPPELKAAVKAGTKHKKQFSPLTPEQVTKMVRAYRAAWWSGGSQGESLFPRRSAWRT